MPIPKGEFDGNAPAFGKDTADKSDSKSAFDQFNEDVAKVVPPTTEQEPKTPIEGDEDKKADRKFRKEFFQEKQKREALEQRLAELEKPKPQVKEDLSLPKWWTDLYGDTEASKKGFGVWHEQEEARQQEVIEKALKTIEARDSQESLAVKKEEENIDNEFDSFEENQGLTLTAKERIDVLNIIDEFTPKDDDGNYLGATIPVEKAYEILEMKRSIPSATTQQRKQLAGITGGGKSGQGQTTQQFRPGDWGGWRRVVGR
jgi:hypothetical protein